MSFTFSQVPIYGTTVNVSSFDIEATRGFIEEHADVIRKVHNGTSPFDEVMDSDESLRLAILDYEDENSDITGVAALIVDVMREVEENRDIAGEVTAAYGTDDYPNVTIGVTAYRVYPWTDVRSLPVFEMGELEEVVEKYLRRVGLGNGEYTWEYTSLRYFG